MKETIIDLGGSDAVALAETSKKLGVPAGEVLMEALALYHTAAKDISKGHQFGSYDATSQTFTSVTTPILKKQSRPTNAFRRALKKFFALSR